MPTLAGFPQAEIEFDRTGAVLDEAGARAFLGGLTGAGVTDLFVFSHGWNNDTADARRLNEDLFGQVGAVLRGPAVPALPSLNGRSFAVLTVLWPSKRFTDAELIPGGAAALGVPPGQARLLDQLDDAKALFPGAAAARDLDRAKALVPTLDASTQAQVEFVGLIRGLMTKRRSDVADGEDAGDLFRDLPAEEVLQLLQGPADAPAAPAAGEGGAAGIGGGLGGAGGDPGGGAAGRLSDFFGGVVSGAQNLLNLTTYYEMKDRAGLVGTRLGAVLASLGGAGPRLHLVGHSFGARAVSAASDDLAGTGTPVRSLVLLQAAFSHYGFAQDYEAGRDGAFRGVLARQVVTGPVVITCTANDRAVGLAYPLASRLARQVGAAIGDANDRYGGLGRNGAQMTPEAGPEGPLLDVGGTYAFLPGRVFNLRADAFIADHSDITGPQVAYALLAAVAAT